MNNGNFISADAGFCRLIRRACRKAEKIESEVVDTSDVLNQAAFESGFIRESAGLSEEQINGNAYEKADKLLDSLLLEDDIKENLKTDLSELSVQRREILKAITDAALFPAKKVIYAYLKQYYALLLKVVREFYAIKDSRELGRKFLQELLNVDMVFGESRAFSLFYNPAALNGLLHLYECIEEYRSSARHIKDDEMKRQYREIVVYKALRYFRWVVVHDGILMQAAIPSGVLKEQEVNAGLEHNLMIPVRRLSEYNSYEGIGELRLLDKVLYEINRRTEDGFLKKTDREFVITLFGDIHWQPMRELCQLIEYALKTEYREKLPDGICMRFQVYTYNSDAPKAESGRQGIDEAAGENGISVSYEFIKYRGQIMNWKEFDDILENSKLTFLLDSCDLYSEIEVEKTDWNYIRQNIADDFYQKNFAGTDSFEYLLQNLYVFSYSGKTGSLKKTLNQSLLNHLRSKIAKSNTIYIYISDLDAFRTVTYSDQHLMRIERYNEKKMAILILSAIKEESLRTGEDAKEKIIVLSLWQLIKYITVNGIMSFLESVGLSQLTDILTLRNTLIGIDYKNWPEKLNFYYQLPKNVLLPERYEEYLITRILYEVMPFFENHSKDAFYEYYVKSFSSLLYSDAKDVDDMLFLHLFKNKHHLLKETELKGRRDDLTDFRPRKFKYSRKQYYQEIMEDYDTSSQEFAFKYHKLELLRKADPGLHKVIFRNIRQSCERNSYKDSYLYIKFNEM